MAKLIIDTPDKHEDVLNLLKEAGISVKDDDTVENVFQVPDANIHQAPGKSARELVEEILSANSIEFQWGEGLEEEFSNEDEGEEDEEDEY